MAEETPVPLPSAPIIRLAGNATLQPPLSRRGYGPGLVVITPEDPLSPSERVPRDKRENGNESDSRNIKTLDPLPQKKWAEEGYAVVQLNPRGGEQGEGEWDIATALGQAIGALETLEACNVGDRFGLIGKSAMDLYCLCHTPLSPHSTRPNSIMISIYAAQLKT